MSNKIVDNNPNDWIEEAISKEHIRHYEYKHFRNIEKIGNGGFGIVYRANWKNSEQYFALKSFGLDNVTVEKIVHELKFHRKVNSHKNIISFHGITVEGNNDSELKKYLLVMDYADGGSLRKYLKQNFNKLTWKDKYEFAYQLASAVSFLHDEGIVHRDLHSGNILVNQNSIKLTDFGLSKRIEEVSEKHTNIFGIVPYIDPKKFSNNSIQPYSLNEKSDAYSVGVLLWEISSGKPPFEKESYDASLGVRILQGYRETVVLNTPTDYSDIYIDCWNGEPDNRPTMNQVVAKLKQIKNQDNHEKIDTSSNTNDLLNDETSQMISIRPVSQMISIQTTNDLLHEEPQIIPIQNLPINVSKPNTKGDNPKNILIIGRTGGGKSALANVLANTNEFQEGAELVSKTGNFRGKDFIANRTKYRVVDTIGVCDTKLTKNKISYKIAEGVNSMPEGISQILFTVDGRLTPDEIEAFDLFGNSIFENNMIKYITIVRTKFVNFRNDEECKKDKEQLLQKSETVVAEIVKSCNGIVYVDNPPIEMLINDEDDKKAKESNERTRKRSREVLLKHLERVCQREYFKLKKWDKFHKEIVGHIDQNPEENTEDTGDFINAFKSKFCPIL